MAAKHVSSGDTVSGVDELATGERAQIHSVVQCRGRTLGNKVKAGLIAPVSEKD